MEISEFEWDASWKRLEKTFKINKLVGAAGGDRTHFWIKPLATRANIGLHKIQQLKKDKKVVDIPSRVYSALTSFAPSGCDSK